MRVPSADQSGSASTQFGVSVMRRWLDPSAFITATSDDSVRLVVNAIRRPSGDQDGLKFSPSAPVSLRRLEPSGWIVQIPRVPPRMLVYAIRVPSGDQSGSPSNPP